MVSQNFHTSNHSREEEIQSDIFIAEKRPNSGLSKWKPPFHCCRKDTKFHINRSLLCSCVNCVHYLMPAWKINMTDLCGNQSTVLNVKKGLLGGGHNVGSCLEIGGFPTQCHYVELQNFTTPSSVSHTASIWSQFFWDRCFCYGPSVPTRSCAYVPICIVCEAPCFLFFRSPGVSTLNRI